MIVTRSTGTSDPGRKRRRNEDAFVCEPPLFAVADGMGGAQAGEVASRLAASALRDDDGNGTTGEEHVVELIQEANRRVWQRANEDAAASGMGTTITVALVETGNRVLIGHVGDSRAYRLREGRLEQLTDDHSLVAELVRRGELSPQEAETHPQRSVITRALGTDPDVDVDSFPVEARAGDLFLLCSDGLSSMVDHATVEEVLERDRGDLDAAAKALVAAANRGGGEDNITAVLFEVGSSAEEVGGDTLPMRALEEPERPVGPDDEDTLTGLDRIDGTEPPAAVETIVVPPEEARRLLASQAPPEQPAPARPSIWRRLLVLLVIVTLALVIAALVLWGLAR